MFLKIDSLLQKPQTSQQVPTDMSFKTCDNAIFDNLDRRPPPILTRDRYIKR